LIRMNGGGEGGTNLCLSVYHSKRGDIRIWRMLRMQQSIPSASKLASGLAPDPQRSKGN
jgi:hypothetical protein